VLQTALDLIAENFQPVLIEDCVSSRKPNDKHIAVKRIKQAGAIVSTYESILFELTEVSGTDLFKSIVKLVK
jgi:nicotinamidase-related amidase